MLGCSKHSKRFNDSEVRAIIHARMQQTQQEVYDSEVRAIIHARMKQTQQEV